MNIWPLLCAECNFPMGWAGSHPYGYIICNGCAEKKAEAEDIAAATNDGSNP